MRERPRPDPARPTRQAGGAVWFCQTLHNTVFARRRVLIPLLGNPQRAAGSTAIPKALRPYLGGREEFRPVVKPKAAKK